MSLPVNPPGVPDAGALPSAIADAPRTMSFPELEDAISQAQRIHPIMIGGLPEAPTNPISPVDEAIAQARTGLVEGFPTLVQNLARRKVIDGRQQRAVLKQAAASTPGLQAAIAANEGSLSAFNDPLAPPTVSRQLSLEELYTIYDFVQISLAGTTLEILEQEIFEENYIAGSILEKTASAVIGDGYRIMGYDAVPKSAEAASEIAASAKETEILETWIANLNRVHTFNYINRRIVMARRSLGNAYVEVLSDRESGADRLPAGLQPMVTSSMRVMKGHRGYIQWVAGQMRWFNVYTPVREQREDGVRLWEAYWRGRGIDPTSDAFIASPLSRMLSSAMPVGTWNPYLTEVIHLKGEWLRSNYYGFPRDYRLSLLWPLLKYTLLYNVSYQRNSRIPPFVLMWHGPLDDGTFNSINQRFANLQGAANFGKTILLQCEAGVGSTGAIGSSAPKTGLEIIRIADDKDGVFLPIWDKTERNHAMHYSIPWDLLDTENSNKASVTNALVNFDVLVCNDLRNELEQDLYQPITREDLGLERKRIELPRANADDELSRAQIHHIYLDDGVMNPNEVRDDLGKTARPGGDLYREIVGGGVTMEDEAAEEQAAEAGEEMQRAERAAETAVGGEGADDDDGDE